MPRYDNFQPMKITLYHQTKIPIRFDFNVVEIEPRFPILCLHFICTMS